MINRLLTAEWFRVFLLLCLALAFRWWLISGHHVYFYYDQARDFLTVRQLVAGDLKLQGPSVSGTNESIYHGVLYYYVLAPLFLLSRGDPSWVARWLAVAAVVGLGFFYLSVKAATANKRIALLSLFLAAVSFEHAQFSVWLSNPQLLLLIIPWLYWSLWQVFVKRRCQFWLVGSLLGLATQAVVLGIYLWFPIGLFWWWRQIKIAVRQQARQFFVLTMSFALVTSSMFLTQLKMWRAGIFTFGQQFADAYPPSFDSWTQLVDALSPVWSKYLNSLFPFHPLWSALLVVGLVWWVWKQKPAAVRVLLLTWIFSPLVLLMLHLRRAYHLQISIELPLIAIFAWWMLDSFGLSSGSIIQQRVRQVGVGLLVVMYVAAQVSAAHLYRSQAKSPIFAQEGALLSDQLALIDKTYQVARQEPFSISIFANPYHYPSTWIYLYQWYGQQQYDYLPELVGLDQSGFVGSDSLTTLPTAHSIHFSITESGVMIPEQFRQEFVFEQNQLAGPPTQSIRFGSLSLEVREKLTN